MSLRSRLGFLLRFRLFLGNNQFYLELVCEISVLGTSQTGFLHYILHPILVRCLVNKRHFPEGLEYNFLQPIDCIEAFPSFTRRYSCFRL